MSLTRDQLVAMHPYVIDIPDGRLAEGPSTLPTSVDDFKTTKADVDAIFETHLPAFLVGRTLPSRSSSGRTVAWSTRRRASVSPSSRSTGG